MARPTTFGRDRKLQFRMLLVMFLLGAVYTGLTLALLFSGINIAFIVVLVAGLFLVQVFTAQKLALHMMGARVVTPSEAPELHAMIERLCIQANLPKPKVAVADMRMPNAFALGTSPKNATVCATTGIMDMLTPAELEGVMAHELSHVASRDVMVMTIASFFATVAAFITRFGFFFGGDRRGGGNNNYGILIVILVSIAVYVVSFVLLQALSRYREYAADRGAAILTGRPSALASALIKISSGMHRIPKQDLRSVGQLKAFYIFPPGTGEAIGELFSSHPRLEKRLAALDRLEKQLQSKS